MTKADLLLHPVRLRVVQALLGREMTPQQLVEVLGDVPQATLYRHVAKLADGGMLAVVSERPVRGVTERTYGVVRDAVSLGPDDLAGLSAQDHAQRFHVFAATMLASFGRAVQAADGPDGVDPVAERIGYRVAPMWLTDDEVDAVLEELRAVVGRVLDNDPTAGRRRRLLYTVLLPDA